ncbi:hypothetical protein FRACA_1040012 [Frankia canadensis]|uniref:Uncharacterized protein n=1 Tax=Frankia canadensis TaxID=1836972 RepID=A0A2I2KIY5_9ACTN|nr:hypothetical protein FRACA_1040012 [Frankia canadensis]SOU52897.1 hypothetical protein FRACA_1040012 [Frankia canadensis]
MMPYRRSPQVCGPSDRGGSGGPESPNRSMHSARSTRYPRATRADSSGLSRYRSSGSRSREASTTAVGRAPAGAAGPPPHPAVRAAGRARAAASVHRVSRWARGRPARPRGTGDIPSPIRWSIALPFRTDCAARGRNRIALRGTAPARGARMFMIPPGHTRPNPVDAVLERVSEVSRAGSAGRGADRWNRSPPLGRGPVSERPGTGGRSHRSVNH